LKSIAVLKVENFFDTFSPRGRTPLGFCVAKSSVVTVFQEKGSYEKKARVSCGIKMYMK
jgi:hypothetical protein